MGLSQMSQTPTRQVGLHEMKQGPCQTDRYMVRQRLSDGEEGSKWPECRGSENENFGRELPKGQTRVTMLKPSSVKRRRSVKLLPMTLIQGEHVVGGKSAERGGNRAEQDQEGETTVQAEAE